MMRIIVKFEFDKLELPIQYNHIMQAVVLNLINDEEYRKFVHDKGFSYQKRKFKLYTFSRLLGKFQIDKERKTISFNKNANFIISSYDENFCYYLMEKLMQFRDIKIGRNNVRVQNVEVENYIPEKELKVVTRSPVTIYSTYFDENSSKKTLFYHPDDYKFRELLEKNIIKKYMAIFKKEPEGRIEIKHVGKSPKKVMIIYKNFKIIGWLTAFDLYSNNKELLKIAYDSGLGAKNSQGFGLVDVVKK